MQSRDTATIDAHGYDCSYSHNYTLSVKLACLTGKSADGVYMAVRFISAWGLRLLVSTAWAIRRPQDVERVTGTVSTLLYIYTENVNQINFARTWGLLGTQILLYHETKSTYVSIAVRACRSLGMGRR